MSSRPRIRTIKPEMWQDEKIGQLSYGARLLLIGMVTMADDEGRFRAPTSALLGHIFPYDDEAPRRLRGWVEEVKRSGMVVFYIATELPYGAFRHWRAHQRINRPRPSLLPPPPNHDVVRDNSVSDHDPITNGSVNDHGSSAGNSFSHAQARVPDPIPSLCKRLSEGVKRNDARAQPKITDRWLTDMRLLVDDRGGDVAEVERIIDWCQADPFWRSNILSPAKLRKQFTQLLLRAESNVTPMRRESPSDLLRALRGGNDDVIEGTVA